MSPLTRFRYPAREATKMYGPRPHASWAKTAVLRPERLIVATSQPPHTPERPAASGRQTSAPRADKPPAAAATVMFG